MASSVDEDGTSLTVRGVHLPLKAYDYIVAKGFPSESRLVDIQYRRGPNVLKVYVAVSAATSRNSPDISEPFQSVCDVNGRKLGLAPFRGQWICVAQFDDMAPCTAPQMAETEIVAGGSLAVPGGLCHPHLHLDKCFLLDRCKMATGTFDEAMKQTAHAKAKFDHDDLMSRGRRLIYASISHSVTAMRAHVEVDPTVRLLCVGAGIALKAEFGSTCEIMLVAFAQDPLLYPDDPAKELEMAKLLEQAAQMPEVSAIGSAPYVESSADGPKAHFERQQRNIQTVFDLAARYGKDVDLHLDYDLDPTSESLLPYVLELTAEHTWQVHGRVRRVTIGHCTKLSVLPRSKLAEISRAIDAIPRGEGERWPVSFVGLPPSDVYMQGRGQPYSSRSRATLPLLDIADELDACCALGVNNVANLFTPQGDADPLALLPWATALYQDATQPTRLLDFVSTHARHAAGLESHYPALWKDLSILDTADSIQSAVLAPPFGRVTIKDGLLVSNRTVTSHIWHTPTPYPHKNSGMKE